MGQCQLLTDDLREQLLANGADIARYAGAIAGAERILAMRR